MSESQESPTPNTAIDIEGPTLGLSQTRVGSAPYRRGEFALLVLQVVFDFLIVLVTSIYAGFAYKQWQAINRQADSIDKQVALMNQTIEQTQAMIRQQEVTDRPYIAVKEISIADYPSGEPALQVTLENMGNPPAHNVFLNTCAVVTPDPIQTLPPCESKEPESRFFMAAGSSISMSLAIKKVAKDPQAIWTGALRFYAFGTANYEDGLKRRTLKFCGYFNPHLGQSRPAPSTIPLIKNKLKA